MEQRSNGENKKQWTIQMPRNTHYHVTFTPENCLIITYWSCYWSPNSNPCSVESHKQSNKIIKQKVATRW
jgi:hypothetical protein